MNNYLEGRLTQCPHPKTLAKTITGFCFECWERRRTIERAALQVSLAAQLAAGDTIVEELGRLTTAWSLTMEPRPFIPECMTAAYLAEHLTSRHYGFGTVLSSRKGGA